MSQSRREVLRRQQEAQAKAKRLNRIVAMAAIVVGVVLVGIFGVILAQTWGSGGTSTAATPPNATSNANGIIVNPGKGTDSSPTVELFVDYQCPVCKQFDLRHGPMIRELADSGQIKLIYRTMNFLDNNLRNDSSTRAAVAAACTDSAGVYSAYHDAIFANQPAVEGDGYPTDLLRVTLPATVGLSGDKLTSFQQCYDTRSTLSFVKGTNEAAARDGITGTPALRINGKAIEFAAFFNIPSDQLKALILAG